MIKKLIFENDGQAMTEYILTLSLLVLITIPALKIIPKAFGNVFKQIVRFHSYHLDKLAGKLSGLLP